LSPKRYLKIKPSCQLHAEDITIISVLLNREFTKLDQENISKLVEEWKVSGSSDDSILFRTYFAGEESNNVVSSTSDDDEPIPVMQSQQSMLFVHQLAW